MASKTGFGIRTSEGDFGKIRFFILFVRTVATQHTACENAVSASGSDTRNYWFLLNPLDALVVSNRALS